MKIITIYYSNENPIIIKDSDKTDLDNYTKKLTEIFDVNKVVILKTTSGNHILKPSKIVDISIIEKNEDIDSIEG